MVVAKGLWGVTALLVLFFLSGPGQAAPLGDLLARADRFASTDRRGFEAALAQARPLLRQATPAERDLYDLLLAYRGALDGDYEQAIASSRRLAGEAHLPELRYRAAFLVANTAAITRDYALGFRYLGIGFHIEGQVRSLQARQHGWVVAATLYNQFGDFKSALDNADRVLASGPDARKRCFAHENRVRALTSLGKGSDGDYERALLRCRQAGETLVWSLVHASYGRHLVDRGRPERAVEVVSAALPASDSIGYTRLAGELQQVLAEAQLAQGNEDAAASAARRVLQIPGQHPHWSPLIGAHRVLYTIAQRRGDAPGALHHFRAYHTAERARLDEIQAREYARLTTQLGVVERERQAELLRHQNQSLRLQQRVADERARTMRLAIVLLGLVAVGIGYVAWQFRRTHHRLRRMTELDALTGVASRAHFAARAAALVAACRKQDRPVSMLVLDLDHFKQINDQCGHAVGDWVLREVANACLATCPPGDIVGRMGGEEFVMTLQGAGAERAAAVAESLRLRIAAIDGPAGGCHLPITASIGTAGSTVSGHAYQRLLADADAAMYAAKRRGRNAVQGAALPRCA